jgi:hypothetical protein
VGSRLRMVIFTVLRWVFICMSTPVGGGSSEWVGGWDGGMDVYLLLFRALCIHFSARLSPSRCSTSSRICGMQFHQEIAGKDRMG